MLTNNLASAYESEGRYAEAEKLHRQTLEILRRVLGPDHPDTLIGIENVAIDVSHEGYYGEAEQMFRGAIETAANSSQPGVLDNAWYYFARTAASAGHHDEALDYLRKAIDLGFRQPDTIAAEDDLKSLRGDPRFATLVAKARQPVTAKTQGAAATRAELRPIHGAFGTSSPLRASSFVPRMMEVAGGLGGRCRTRESLSGRGKSELRRAVCRITSGIAALRPRDG